MPPYRPRYLQIEQYGNPLMFKKMVAGELGLGTTFWKYGVLFLLILTFIVKFFEKLLHRQTGSADLLYFFSSHFNLFKSNPMIIFWTLCYASAIIGLFYYAINFTGGLWRSSANYERSSWLKNLARCFTIILLFACLKILL